MVQHGPQYALILVLVKALHMAHDHAQGINVLWPNPGEALQELRRRMNESRDRGHG